MWEHAFADILDEYAEIVYYTNTKWVDHFI